MVAIVSWLKRQKTLFEARLYSHLYALRTVSIDDLAPPLPEVVEPILDHIYLPPYHGLESHDDLTPLVRIVTHLAPKVILEFGTAYGNTTANICAVSDARVFTVNARPDQLTGRLITCGLAADEIGCVYRKYGFGERVTQIYENTLQFDHRVYFDHACVDLAIIDACHDTDYVISDFTRILPTLNTKATVLFHDTHPTMEGHLFDSYFACLLLRKRGFDIRHIDGTWWAIWQQ